MERFLPALFLLNGLLVIIDAAIGYHVAPFLVEKTISDDDVTEGAVARIRTMLSVVVALYMFFNCLAYFRHNPTLILCVTGIVLIDIIAQLVVRLKLKGKST